MYSSYSRKTIKMIRVSFAISPDLLPLYLSESAFAFPQTGIQSGEIFPVTLSDSSSNNVAQRVGLEYEAFER
jgi:hypothetical protein